MATVALRRLDLLDEETPVVLGGGVLAARHPQLDDRVARTARGRAPRRPSPRVVTAPPVLGAALLGLDRTGAPPEAYARLRGALRAVAASGAGERGAARRRRASRRTRSRTAMRGRTAGRSTRRRDA